MLQVIPNLVAEGVLCDACVTDPPYHLAAMSARFGPGQKAATSPDHQRFAKGFMGQTWDGGDIAFRVETWAAVYSILRPGAFLLAFGGTRTHHRMVCAIENAGFVIQDEIDWAYGSGFPKRKDNLKPAKEPICLAYKPGGARTLQVDECRILISDQGGRWGDGRSDGSCWGPGRTNGGNKPEGHRHELGRWPANIIHDGSEEVLACFPAVGNSHAPDNEGSFRKNHVYGADPRPREFHPGFADSGSAARYFYCAK